jgi:hypothetical protein
MQTNKEKNRTQKHKRAKNQQQQQLFRDFFKKKNQSRRGLLV